MHLLPSQSIVGVGVFLRSAWRRLQGHGPILICFARHASPLVPDRMVLMDADDAASRSDATHLAGLESQILNSQEIIVRLNGELDSALLRIETLETFCSDYQDDLHEKRQRIKQLDEEINEREERNEILTQDLNDKDERLKHLDELILQLKQHIKQAKHDNEDEHDLPTDQTNLERDLGQLMLRELGHDRPPVDSSPDILLHEYHQHHRKMFRDLLERSLAPDVVDPEDILFEPFTRLRDRQEQSTRECMDYLRIKIPDSHDRTDFDLVQAVLHDHVRFQQQQAELQEYLQTNDDGDLARTLIERCTEAVDVRTFDMYVIRESDDFASLFQDEQSVRERH